MIRLNEMHTMLSILKACLFCFHSTIKIYDINIYSIKRSHLRCQKPFSQKQIWGFYVKIHFQFIYSRMKPLLILPVNVCFLVPNVCPLLSAPVQRTKPHFPQHTGRLAGRRGDNWVHQCILQRRTAQPVSMETSWGDRFNKQDKLGWLRQTVLFFFSLQVFGEDHRRSDDVLPSRDHPDLQCQPQRSCAQLPVGQHLQDRSLPAQSEAALQVSPPLPLPFWTIFFFSSVCWLVVSPSPFPLSDPSQSDPETRDFWFNMQALQLYLQREAELNPQASYYNVGVLKYQVRKSEDFLFFFSLNRKKSC